MMKGLLGRKLGMTQVFTEDGVLIPVTVVEVTPNVVLQKKTVETDGYNAVQLGFEEIKEKRTTKANIGHCKKANTSPKRFIKEVRDCDMDVNVGDLVNVDIFAAGETVERHCRPRSQFQRRSHRSGFRQRSTGKPRHEHRLVYPQPRIERRLAG